MLTIAADFIWSLLGWPEPQPAVYLVSLATGVGVTWYMSRSGRFAGFPVGKLWLVILAIVVLAFVALIAIYYVLIRREL